MKKNILKTLLFCLLTFSSTLTSDAREFKVLQFNIWQEGTVITNGFEAIADEISRSNADFVTLSEVRNYHGTRFCDRIVQALKNRGKTYYSFYSDDSGLLSRHPIIDSLTVYPLNDDRGSIYKMITVVGGQEFAVYTAHLDYRNCACYDARGYDGNTWKRLDAPVTDVKKIIELNRLSARDDAIMRFIEETKKDITAKRVVILGGDFNEPSCLDWTEATKDMYDHHGLVVPWDVSVILKKGGFKDSYRQLYPNPVTHPGFTFPADCRDVALEKLVWSPEADDRDRIDFIMYKPFKGLTLKEVKIIGPKGDIVKGRRKTNPTSDPIILPLGIWPTDHKAVLATFELE